MSNLLAGKWRIIDTECWDIELDEMLELKYIRFDNQGSGEFCFDAATRTFTYRYTESRVHFFWDGRARMNEVPGYGWAALQGDGNLSGELNFDDGIEVSFIAEKWDSLISNPVRPKYDREAILKQAERLAPSPKHEPMNAGFVGAASVGFILVIFSGIAGIEIHGQVEFSAMILILLGFFGPYIFFKRQQDRHDREFFRLLEEAREKGTSTAAPSP